MLSTQCSNRGRRTRCYKWDLLSLLSVHNAVRTLKANSVQQTPCSQSKPQPGISAFTEQKEKKMDRAEARIDKWREGGRRRGTSLIVVGYVGRSGGREGSFAEDGTTPWDMGWERRKKRDNESETGRPRRGQKPIPQRRDECVHTRRRNCIISLSPS